VAVFSYRIENLNSQPLFNIMIAGYE